jgi:hypothetical protein
MLKARICANVKEHMIANLREFRISKTQAVRFQAALEAFDQNPPAGDSLLVQAQRDSLTSQLEDLLEEITAFEALHDSKRTSLNLSDLVNRNDYCQFLLVSQTNYTPLDPYGST